MIFFATAIFVLLFFPTVIFLQKSRIKVAKNQAFRKIKSLDKKRVVLYLFLMRDKSILKVLDLKKIIAKFKMVLLSFKINTLNINNAN